MKHNAKRNALPAKTETPYYEMNPNQPHYYKLLASETPRLYNYTGKPTSIIQPLGESYHK